METSSLESWVRATARAMLVHMDDIAERRREAFASSSSVRASRELGCAERALPLVCWRARLHRWARRSRDWTRCVSRRTQRPHARGPRGKWRLARAAARIAG